ncbi:hypothetical protein [Streptomyces sp. URMC 123]|uniref:hypothetical protein n=1 Tax=Streptomyces sp. URMC 123 TaxID=3423403 RepID=UPI003F1E22A4
MTGASTIVAAMATSAWDVARDRTVALFRRHGDAGDDVTGGSGGSGGTDAGQGATAVQGDAVRAELEACAAYVQVAAEPEDARGAQARRWHALLDELLRRDPEAARELAVLIQEVQGRLRSEQPTWQQSVAATAGGSAYGALGPGSSVHIHHHAPPQPPAPRPAGPGESGS